MAKHRKTNLLRDPVNPLPLKEEVDWFRERVLEWAKDHGRDFPWRHIADEYQLVVTEILLQQTTANAVARQWDAFFTAYPDWQALHAVDEDALREHISVLGLGRQRARRLKQLAAWVAAHDWHLPATRGELEDVPGIGQYVASVLLAVKYGQPEPMLDVNMARVLERFFGVRELADIRDDPWLQAVSRRIVSSDRCSWGLLDLAADTCRSVRPICATCPLRCRCARPLN